MRSMLPAVRSALALVLVIAGLMLGAPARTSAQEAAPAVGEDVTAEAQALFRRGLELGTEDRWADALEHFRRSYARVERPSTLFNIGVALGRLGRFREAVAVFDELFAGEAAIPPEVRSEAERLRGEAIASLGELALTVAPADAVVAVDGDDREGSGSPRVLPLDPGRHVVRATADGYDEAELEVSVVAGEHTSASLALVPRPIVTPPIVEGPRPITDEPAFWIVGGVIVVAIGVGVGLGVGFGTAEPPPPYGGTTGVVLLMP